MANPPKPLEVKLRNGNPGKRALPDRATLTALPGKGDTTPIPARVLGPTGAAMWERIWNAGAVWLARDIDVETVLVLCESMDERQILRNNVVKYGDWRERGQLRLVDKQVMQLLGALGFNPVERSRLGVAEVKNESSLDRVRRERTG